MIAIFLLIAQILIGFFLLFLIIAFITGAPFVPTSNPAVSVAIKLAKLKKGDTIIDLGSGDGRILFAAAKQGATAIGYEINPFLVLYTNIRAKLSKNNRVKAKWKNFWTSSFHEADAVFVYLLPWKMKALEKKLIRELETGSRVVSNSFIFPHLKPLDSDTSHHIHSFVISKNASS